MNVQQRRARDRAYQHRRRAPLLDVRPTRPCSCEGSVAYRDEDGDVRCLKCGRAA